LKRLVDKAARLGRPGARRARQLKGADGAVLTASAPCLMHLAEPIRSRNGEHVCWAIAKGANREGGVSMGRGRVKRGKGELSALLGARERRRRRCSDASPAQDGSTCGQPTHQAFSSASI
jgi:hypothetical protein